MWRAPMISGRTATVTRWRCSWALIIMSARPGIPPRWKPGWWSRHGTTSRSMRMGDITFFDDEARLRDLLERLTATHESGRKTPWQITDAPADYIARQMRAIVGFSLRVDTLEGQWKLSQNKDQADHGGVMRGLEDEGAHDILS